MSLLGTENGRRSKELLEETICRREEHSLASLSIRRSDPGNQDGQSPWRWYQATTLQHNACTCHRGKVDGRDLDARGSRVPEAVRPTTKSTEAR